jgi:hypothetical protein
MWSEEAGKGILCTGVLTIDFLFFSQGWEWADPGGTAIPGQPVEDPEQAPVYPPSSKNQFNIEVPTWGTYQILS